MSTHPDINAYTEVIGELRQKLNACVLPITRCQRDHLLEQLGSDLLSITELTHQIMRVPVAALHICRQAGEAARKRDVDVLTLEQACSLLGTQRLINLLRELPVVEHDQLPRPYRQLLSISEHAVGQAQGLFANRIARLWQEMSLATLLFLSPLWALTYLKPHLFEQWDRLNRGALPEGVTRTRIAATTTAGFQLVQLVAQDWWLPPWILQGYRSLNDHRRTMVKALHVARDSTHPQEQLARLDADRDLYRWLTQPANGVLIASGLALGAHSNWYTSHTLRWQQLAALYLNCDVPEAQRLSHENAVENARTQYQAVTQDLLLPAATLPWTEQPAAIEQLSATLPLQGNVVEQPEQTRARPAHWRALCLQLSATPSPFENLGALLDCAQQALQDGLGAERSWIALAHGASAQLVVRSNAGFEPDLFSSGSRVGPSKNSVWLRWLSSAACHSVSASHLQFNQLPTPLQQHPYTTAFHLAPVMHNQQVLALIFVAGEQGRALSHQRQQALVKTAQCLHKALVQFKQRA
ncbi:MULTISPECIES: hypothetical protein [Pseudomonas]|jgi:hypothetical protein|uniref:HDOD domain-containing protein n=1 Tax=Pseudomonas abyssi TaxID=170540 RepID=A0A2A3MKW8_9PSED|nr:hypothetical protein [Pseudomonas abyssi]MAC99928.1 hypothetical protein [Pseudomonadales bacterium]PBK05469.1 hypothetical protein CNQ84_02895 [Pseudomonas abyssi]|tara:strand:+ start:18079 stop:19653 length:1575 start_codon:yes stop_codon:yes gene_type:complete